jgi:hypothetical protein
VHSLFVQGLVVAERGTGLEIASIIVDKEVEVRVSRQRKGTSRHFEEAIIG